jgi:hypothetical protein
VLAGCVAVIVFGEGSSKADFTFGQPVNLGPMVNSSAGEVCPSISPNGLELYFHSLDLPGGYGNGDLWVSRRAMIEDPWETPINLGPIVNSPSYEYNPVISPDGLSLYFMSSRPGGFGLGDIWVSTRPVSNDPWREPVNLGSMINSPASETRATLSADGLELYFCASGRTGGHGDSDLWVATRATGDDVWSTPIALPTPLNTPQYDGQPAISVDGLLLIFRSKREGGIGANDMWMSTRPTKTDAWGTPVNLGSTVNSPDSEAGPSISASGRELYFHSARPEGFGSHDVYYAPIIPIVDFNGDEVVDSADMCVMVDHWGENYSLCDIGPMPWGDGVVDVEDLKVLAENLFGEVNDPTLIAHWALDEAEGFLASDSAGDNDAYAIGGPAWQPAGGMIDGAIQLDGVNDYVITAGSPVNPAEGPFSVLARIKGGVPGQVIVAQQLVTDWLSVDAEGRLMTELKGADGLAIPLISETIITDEEWHRVGLMWDGSRRTLCVDGVAVAEDTQTGSASSSREIPWQINSRGRQFAELPAPAII